MCRIIGFTDFNFHSDYNLEETAVSMRDTLTHGGPDDAGLYVDKQKGLALGHRRLSILDLSELGHQPMANEDKSLWITYNGEVYNFKEIRKELEGHGHRFRSNTDTEVVLKSYEKWGKECVHKFRGMWAFAIWDKSKQKLVLCRDRVGVKPLYYYYQGGLFLFASELRAFPEHPKFRKKLDRKTLSLYLQFGYIPAPFSILEGVKKLEPAHFLEIGKDGTVTQSKYWSIRNSYANPFPGMENNGARPNNEVCEELETVLTESFSLRLIADVPVGVFLSGGTDSTLVAALLQKNSSKRIKTFTVGFNDEKFNEAPWAKKVAEYLGTDHMEFYCSFEDAYGVIKKLPEIYDEPFGDSSCIPTYLVSKLARANVKVSLSADGGDELFCGYEKYWLYPGLMDSFKKIPSFLKKAASYGLRKTDPFFVEKIYNHFQFMFPKVVNFSGKYTKFANMLGNPDRDTQYRLLHTAYSEESLRALHLPDPYDINDKMSFLRSSDLTSQAMRIDFETYLPDDLLVKLDRATMAVSLEGREPFLDHKVIEYAARLPLEYKYKNKQGKRILKQILHRYVPANLVQRPKQGFSVPYDFLSGDRLKDLYAVYLDEGRLKREGIFNPEYVNTLRRHYLKTKNPSLYYKLWYLFCFQQWKEYWKV